MHYVCMLYIVYVREISIGVAKLGSLVRYTSLLTALIETLLYDNSNINKLLTVGWSLETIGPCQILPWYTTS